MPIQVTCFLCLKCSAVYSSEASALVHERSHDTGNIVHIKVRRLRGAHLLPKLLQEDIVEGSDHVAEVECIGEVKPKPMSTPTTSVAKAPEPKRRANNTGFRWRESASENESHMFSVEDLVNTSDGRTTCSPSSTPPPIIDLCADPASAQSSPTPDSTTQTPAKVTSPTLFPPTLSFADVEMA